MRRIAVAVYSLLISGISKLTGLSDARVSVKFMIALLAVLLPCSVLVFTTNLRATSNIITVNNTTDPASTSGNGFCTLREAINNANAASDTSGGDCAPGTGTDTIKFSVSGTITLVQGTLPAIANSSPGSLTIDGSGQTIAIDGANSFRVLQVNAGTLSLNSLTIAHGNGGAGNGGAIYNVGTSLTITNCTLSGNSTTTSGGSEGGAILSSGSVLTVDNSNFSDNSVGFAQSAGSGGAIAAGGTVTITNSTFSGNSASVGGAIFDADAENNVTVRNSTFTTNSAFNNGGAIGCFGVLITNSTFNGNTAGINGGGVDCTNAAISGSTFTGNTARFGSGIIDGGAGLVTVTNSTFSGNGYLAADGGGGIYAEDSTLTVNNSTFSGNLASNGGGLYINSSTLNIANSIVSNSQGGNCFALNETFNNSGYNISDDATCGFGSSTGANGKTIGDNTNPLLDPNGLQNNGGPTKTIGLQSTSPAVDAVPLAGCPATDQRGYQRPDSQENACDMGAYESGSEGAETLIVSPSPPSKLNFGTVSVGTTSASQTATITSEFNDDTVDFFATFILANYIKTGSTCGATLGPLQSCQVSFACKPKTTGPLIGAYAFLYGSVETAGLRDGDDYLKIGVAQFTCTGS
jgi:hypothetical protein